MFGVIAEAAFGFNVLLECAMWGLPLILLHRLGTQWLLLIALVAAYPCVFARRWVCSRHRRSSAWRSHAAAWRAIDSGRASGVAIAHVRHAPAMPLAAAADAARV
jgi:hypothetical protein